MAKRGKKKKALIFQGGWDGHTPEATASVFATELKDRGWSVRVEDNLKCLERKATVKGYDLIMPVWTMGELTPKQFANLDEAVRAGTGLGGVHGGMGDAFRGNLSYQWMCGGQFVGHPHVGDYWVTLTDSRHPVTRGMKERFKYNSEQYYMLIDPAVNVLAKTIYRREGQRVEMPVIWTRPWGKGRVFYSALGHVAEEFTTYPDVRAMSVRGLLWAAR